MLSSNRIAEHCSACGHTPASAEQCSALQPCAFHDAWFLARTGYLRGLSGSLSSPDWTSPLPSPAQWVVGTPANMYKVSHTLPYTRSGRPEPRAPGFFTRIAARGVRGLLPGWVALSWLLSIPLVAPSTLADPITAASAWPVVEQAARPWAYNWWMGSAVDETNIVRELTRYRDAGLGGIHIIPIYQADGWETRSIEYLSPRWMEILSFTVAEAEKLGLGVDMTTGTGWCFGGPHVTDEEANASVVWQTFSLEAGERLTETFTAAATQSLMAFGPDGQAVELTGRVAADGKVDWQAPEGRWTVCAVSQRPSGQQVKRAAPGGEGPMLNLIYPLAVTNYLRWFDAAFAAHNGPKPRAQYHDSYEYRSDWAPDFFAEFERRRGYRLQDELPALFFGAQPPRRRGDPDAARPNLGLVNPDRAARVKGDYRETISDVMCEVTLPHWAEWSREHGFLTRNEAHGSPGNWLDLYAAADIPETEMFHLDRNKLVSKFSSSAAHVMGKPLVGCETGTWLKDHFTVTLADLKYLFDDLFLSGVNHIFYHGTCYSPDQAGWPGWVFYASTQMNPRNSIWRDAPVLNAYAARCQSVLQSGQPDNDLLLYWPIHDLWHSPTGLARNLTVHARDWFEEKPIGHAASNLWHRGWSFDYVSDRQLALAKVEGGEVRMPGGLYRAVVVPRAELIPVDTMARLLALAEGGVPVVFEEQLPSDVPGLAQLDQRRAELARLTAKARSLSGRVLIGELEEAFARAGLGGLRETMFDQPGLMCVRRALPDGRFYFIANRGTERIEGGIPLATAAKSAIVMDPLTGGSGVGAVHPTSSGSRIEVDLQLLPGSSIIVRTVDGAEVTGSPWTVWAQQAEGTELQGEWNIEFISGGPELPPAIQTTQLASWTELGGEEAWSFAGAARYTLTFDAPKPPRPGQHAWRLDLGTVAQSARVRLNGRDLGTLIVRPFAVAVRDFKPTGNVLEVEVTNLSANRIRDLDRRGVEWRTFHDINFVNINYRPFDASKWPLADSGLLGPVTLTPVGPSMRAAAR